MSRKSKVSVDGDTPVDVSEYPEAKAEENVVTYTHIGRTQKPVKRSLRRITNGASNPLRHIRTSVRGQIRRR